MATKGFTAFVTALVGAVTNPTHGIQLQTEDGFVSAAVYESGTEINVTGKCKMTAAGSSVILENDGTPLESDSFKITLFRSSKPKLGYKIVSGGQTYQIQSMDLVALQAGEDGLIYWPGETTPQVISADSSATPTAAVGSHPA